MNEPGILGWIPSRMGVGQVDIVMWEMGICGDIGVWMWDVVGVWGTGII